MTHEPLDPTIIAALITVVGTIVAVIIGQKMNERALKRQSRNNDSQKNIKQGNEVIENATQATKNNHKSEGVDINFIVGVGLTLLCAVIFGVSHVLGKYLVIETTNPLFVASLRNFVSGLFIFIVAQIYLYFANTNRHKIDFTIDSLLMVIGRVFSSLFYFFTLMYLSATTTITLYKINTIFTFIILLFLVQTFISKLSFYNIIIGIMVTLIGVLLAVMGNEPDLLKAIQANYIGVTFSLLAGVFWSIYIVFSERYSSKHPEYTSFGDRQKYVSFIYLISSLPLILFLFLPIGFLPENLSIENIDYSSKDILSITILGCVSGIIGILYFEALKRISSLLVGVLISLEIFFTMIFEKIFLEVDVTFSLFIGATLIILGAISVGRESKKLKL